MANERLRSAITDAELDVDQLAGLLRVDAKTVHRWLSGRIPYPRHRTKIAKALGREERDLWPESTPQPQPQDQDTRRDIIAAYPRAGDPDAPDWRALLRDATERIELLDYTLLEIVQDDEVIELLAAKGAGGATVRMMISDQDSVWVTATDVDELGTGEDYHGNGQTALAIQRAHGHLEPLIGKAGIEIREFLAGRYNSILRFDDQMLLTLHVWGMRGDQAPLLHLRREDDDGLFNRFAAHFDALWETAQPLESDPETYPHPRENPERYEFVTDEEAQRRLEQSRRESLARHRAAHPDTSRSPNEETRTVSVSTPLLSAEERERLTALLTEWDAPPQLIQDTLTDAAFGPGVMALQPDDPALRPGIGIIVDEERDPDLARLFERRGLLDDQSFIADWEAGPRPHTRVLLCPHGPEAMLAYTIEVIRPITLTRTFLLLISKQAAVLSALQLLGAADFRHGGAGVGRHRGVGCERRSNSGVGERQRLATKGDGGWRARGRASRVCDRFAFAVDRSPSGWPRRARRAG